MDQMMKNGKISSVSLDNDPSNILFIVSLNDCVGFLVKILNAWYIFLIVSSHMQFPIRWSPRQRWLRTCFFFPFPTSLSYVEFVAFQEHLLIWEWSCFLAVFVIYKLKTHKRATNMKKSDDVRTKKRNVKEWMWRPNRLARVERQV